jgi:hypothetical protein
MQYGQLKREQFHAYLLSAFPTVFIVENFRVRPGTNFTWQEHEVIRVIGAIEYQAFIADAEVVFQEPAIKSIGYKWAGLSVPKNHDMSHETDAYAHLVYYNTKVLGLPIPAIQRMREDSDKDHD